MNKYICAGTIVKDIRDRSGKVISVDYRNKTAVICGDGAYWTENFRNLQVVSYREVE